MRPESTHRFKQVQALAREHYQHGDAGHDFAHIERVVASCLKLGPEAGANLDILLPAALLHDVVNVPKNHPDRLAASRMAAEEGARILARLDYSAEDIERITQVILEHSFSLGLKPTSVESAILQDADRLDAIRAIGVMRLVSSGASFRSAYYHPGEPIPRTRPIDDKKYMVDHFYAKLFKLVDLMNTDAGRAEARRRTEFMRQFIAELSREISSAQ